MALEIIGGTASIVALVEVAGKIGLLCGKYISQVRDAQIEAERFSKEVELLSGLLKDVDKMLQGPFGEKLMASQKLSRAIVESQKLLLGIERGLKEGFKDSPIKSPGKKPAFLRKVTRNLKKEALTWPFKKKDVEKYLGQIRDVKTNINLALQIDNIEIVALRDQRDILEKLSVTRDAIFGSDADQHEPKCLEGTRMEIRSDIDKWVASSKDNSLFWLRGMAGTGKSTIARTVAYDFEKKGQLGGSFFFKKSQAGRNSASHFFPTLAYGLAKKIPVLLPHITKAIETDPDICKKTYKEQFDELVNKPLSSVKLPSIIVLVIDALDECEGDTDVPIILTFLGDLTKLQNIDLRIFVTSRPEYAPIKAFRLLNSAEIHYHDLALHEIERSIVSSDIHLYLQHEFARIQNDFSDELPDLWPGEEKIQQLVHIATPWFISAATICRFVEDKYSSPEIRLDQILASNPAHRCGMENVYSLYLSVFESFLSHLDKVNHHDNVTARDEIQRIISTVVMVASPASRESISELTGIDKSRILTRLKPFHSILMIPSEANMPIKTFHLSFRDYLVDEHHQIKNPFFIDVRETHRRIGQACIKIMSKGLRKDICGFKHPGILHTDMDPKIVKERISDSLKYACENWLFHLKQAQDKIEDDGPVHVFLQEYVLYWLEVTGIIGVSTKNIYAVDDLEALVADNGKSCKLSEFVRDIKRFIRSNQYIIAEAPLQIYFSGLCFAPQESLIRKKFADKHLTWAKKLPITVNSWGSLLGTLEHIDYQWQASNLAVFSPDGNILASDCGPTVRLWNPTSGVLLQTLTHPQPLKRANPRRPITWSIAFSPDGKLLYGCQTEYETIDVWDTISGKFLRSIECGEKLHCMALSPDGRQIATNDYMGSLKQWSAQTGALIRELDYRGYDDSFPNNSSSDRILMFSPDSRHLLAAQKAVIIWDAASGSLLRQLTQLTSEGNQYWRVTAVAFSPNGRNLATGVAGHEPSMNIWELSSGALVQTTRPELLNRSAVGALSFSPDGKQIFFGTVEAIAVWDMTSGSVVRISGDDWESVESLAVSPDGKQLVSGSHQSAVKFWDIASSEEGQGSAHYKNPIYHIVHYPDGKRFLSCQSPGILQVWDTETLDLQKVVNMSSDDRARIEHIAISADGTRKMGLFRKRSTSSATSTKLKRPPRSGTLRPEVPTIPPAPVARNINAPSLPPQAQQTSSSFAGPTNLAQRQSQNAFHNAAPHFNGAPFPLGGASGNEDGISTPVSQVSGLTHPSDAAPARSTAPSSVDAMSAVSSFRKNGQMMGTGPQVQLNGQRLSTSTVPDDGFYIANTSRNRRLSGASSVVGTESFDSRPSSMMTVTGMETGNRKAPPPPLRDNPSTSTLPQEWTDRDPSINTRFTHSPTPSESASMQSSVVYPQQPQPERRHHAGQGPPPGSAPPPPHLKFRPHHPHSQNPPPPSHLHNPNAPRLQRPPLPGHQYRPNSASQRLPPRFFPPPPTPRSGSYRNSQNMLPVLPENRRAFSLPSRSGSIRNRPPPPPSIPPTPGPKALALTFTSNHIECNNRHQVLLHTKNYHHALPCLTCRKVPTDGMLYCTFCAMRICKECAARLRKDWDGDITKGWGGVTSAVEEFSASLRPYARMVAGWGERSPPIPAKNAVGQLVWPTKTNTERVCGLLGVPYRPKTAPAATSVPFSFDPIPKTPDPTEHASFNFDSGLELESGPSTLSPPSPVTPPAFGGSGSEHRLPLAMTNGKQPFEAPGYGYSTSPQILSDSNPELVQPRPYHPVDTANILNTDPTRRALAYNNYPAGMPPLPPVPPPPPPPPNGTTLYRSNTGATTKTTKTTKSTKSTKTTQERPTTGHGNPSKASAFSSVRSTGGDKKRKGLMGLFNKK
ncbi:hypothetical protein H072_7385 [Dactylellina haptotyla CBS 200.50]|uniref:Mitochondrial division protein 1 n=1 Tax=Dactylellina haptotyla (strain CBS 200.50) TaxID=1284197 RepID=S8BUB2_DACHA|nr:hypothetical protein H072_7385 [Dactylellina haptotyla CBS 200.50]